MKTNYSREQIVSEAHRQLRSQEGSTLIIMLLIVAAVITLTVYGARSAQVELHIAHNDALSKQALNTAEAGVNHARSVIQGDAGQFNNYLSNGGTGGALSNIGTVVTLSDGLSYRFHAFGGSGPNDGYYVRVVDNDDELTGANDPTHDVDSTVDVISRGRIGSAERIIRARITAPGPCVLGWPTPGYNGCALGPQRGPTPFAENSSMKAIRPVGFALSGTTSVNLFYGDENALTLGSIGDGTPYCTVEPTPAAPACVDNPQIGCVGDTDPANRPIWPALFITDITDDPSSRAGDWQCGGTPQQPTTVCGLWKPYYPAANGDPKSKTKTSAAPNPKTSNGTNLGSGADPFPTQPDNTCSCLGSTHCNCDAENYDAEISWDLASLKDQSGSPVVTGRVYRAQVMVHDGDQNQAGGDVGENCVNFVAP